MPAGLIDRITAGGQHARQRVRSESLRKILGNTSWLLSERALSLLVALTVHVWLARYLGPTEFGVLSYGMSLVALFSTFTYLGLSGVVVRDLVTSPHERNEILGTVYLLKLVGGLAATAAIIVFAALRLEDPTRVVVLVLAAGLVFESFRVIELWFSARVESRFAVLANGAATTLAAAAKVGLILLRAPLLTFAFAAASVGVLRAAGLYIAYRRRGGGLSDWSFRWIRAKGILSQAWPLALASIGAVIYLKIDQVMLGEMLDVTAVGTYAVAARLSEVWYILPTAVSASVFPKILQSKAEGENGYLHRLQRIFDVMAIIALAVAVVVTVTSSVVIRALYGEQYAASSMILAIHIWACPAVFMGAVLSKWLIAEGLLVFSFTRHVMGALVNIGLNLLLIPMYGGVGAAVATVISYTCASFLACYTDGRTVVAGQMMARALLRPLHAVVPRR